MSASRGTLVQSWTLIKRLNQSSKDKKGTQEVLCSVYNDRTSIYKNSQFDFVLDQTSSQRRTYDRAGVGDLIKAVVDVSMHLMIKMKGYHATVFAYGQTGSGKTFTMEGYKYKMNEKGEPVPILTEFNNYTKTPPSHTQDNDGLVPRAIHHLFDMIK